MRRFFSFRDGMQLLSGLGVVAGMIISSVSLSTSSHAGTVTFGSGANAFNIEFVTIGNPGNSADTTGIPNPAGSVDYTYGMGKFEVSEDMINKYNANFGTANNLVITKDSRGANKPATGVSWNEAARFVNWLNISTGNPVAYKFAVGSAINDDIELWSPGDVGYNSSNRYRNSLAKYVLPDYNEWYKAAYYNPNDSSYYDFPTGSNTAPTAVANGTASGTAVYNQRSFGAVPADVEQAGGLSPYGVMGLGGNVYEWEETSFNLLNSSGSSNRAYRGGNFNIAGSGSMRSTNRSTYDYPGAEYYYDVGFRVASVTPSSPPPAVPEPTSMAIFGLGALGIAYRGRRKAKVQG